MAQPLQCLLRTRLLLSSRASRSPAFRRQPYSSRLAQSPALHSSRCRTSIRPRISPPLPPASRHASSTFRPGSRYVWYMLRKNPYQAAIAIVGIIVASVVLGHTVNEYWRMYKHFANYPENVSLKIRRGLYYTDVSYDPPRAIKAYLQALQLAAQENMHPLSDEVIGIRLELIRVLDKSGNTREGISIAEAVRASCLSWLAEHGGEAGAEHARSNVLRWACSISVKLAELYGSPYVADEAKVEQSLVWAVETALKENARRKELGIKTEDDGWMTPDDMGSHFEMLGHYYEKKDNFYFAARLFLQALMVKEERDCHSVILMSNLAAAVAQQRPIAEPGVPPPTPTQLRESARVWAHQAIKLAETIEPPRRTAECDEGCVAATVNLADFEEMDGKVAAARERYEEAASIAHAIGFRDGLRNAEEGLRRLSTGTPRPKPKSNTAKQNSWLSSFGL